MVHYLDKGGLYGVGNRGYVNNCKSIAILIILWCNGWIDVHQHRREDESGFMETRCREGWRCGS